jgi:hypothetical protein
MVGPLLRYERVKCRLIFLLLILINRYDTVDDNGVWHGAALIVTADSSSIYEPHPTLTFSWDPDKPPTANGNGKRIASSFDLGPHPADPHSTILPMSPTPSMYHANGNGTLHPPSVGPNARNEIVPGHEIWVYGGHGG